MLDRQPAWQAEACPVWCARVHEEGDHPDDRAHASDAVAVPVIAREVLPGDGGIVERAYGEELVLELYRRDDADTTWVYIGDRRRQGFEITAECARRLHRQLTDVVGLAEE